MECQHGEPRGSQACALCRHEILKLHDPTRARTNSRAIRPGSIPMPDYVRAELDKITTPQPRATQPDLWSTP